MKQQNNKKYKTNKVNINKNSNVPKPHKKNKVWAVLTAAALGVVLGAGTFAGLCYGVPEVGNLIISHNTQTTKPNAELEEYKLKVEKLNNNIVELTTNIETIAAEKLTLENQIKALNSEHAAQVAEIQAKLAAKETALADAQQELENLQNAVDASETEIASLEAQIEALTSEKLELEAQIETLNIEHETQVNNLNEQITTLNTTINNLTKEKYNLKNIQNYYENKVNELYQELKQYNDFSITDRGCSPSLLIDKYFLEELNSYSGSTQIEKIENFFQEHQVHSIAYKITFKTKEVINLSPNNKITFNYDMVIASGLSGASLFVNGVSTPYVTSLKNTSSIELLNKSGETISTDTFYFYVSANNWVIQEILGIADFYLTNVDGLIQSKVTSIEKIKGDKDLKFIGKLKDFIVAD